MGNSSSFHIGDAYNHSYTFKLNLKEIKWTIHLVDDVKYDRVLSAFQYDKKNCDLLNNCELYLKTLRHPGVPRYVQHYEDVESGRRLIVTDRVTPLAEVIDDIGSLEVISGIRDLLEVMIFFHQTAKVSHNNICIQNIVVDCNGNWQITGLDQMTKLKKENTDVKLLLEVISALFFKITDIGDCEDIFKERITNDIKNDDYNLSLSRLIEDPLFNNDFIEISLFLQNFTLKNQEQKQIFFNDLPSKLYDLPENVIAVRLLRHMLSRLILLEPSSDEYLLPHLLTPYRDEKRAQFDASVVSPLLSEAAFTKHALPLLFRILHVHNSHIRLVILRHLHRFIHLFPVNTLKDFILPQILSGLLADNNDDLVSESLRALALMVPILGGNVVLGTQKYINKSKITVNKFSNCRKKETSMKMINKKASLRSKHYATNKNHTITAGVQVESHSSKALKKISSRKRSNSRESNDKDVVPAELATPPAYDGDSPHCKDDPTEHLEEDDSTNHNHIETPENIICEAFDEDWEDWESTDDKKVNDSQINESPTIIDDNQPLKTHNTTGEPEYTNSLSHTPSTSQSPTDSQHQSEILGKEFEISVNKKLPDISKSGLLIDDIFAEMVPSSYKHKKSADSLLSMLSSVRIAPSSNLFNVSDEQIDEGKSTGWEDDWGDI